MRLRLILILTLALLSIAPDAAARVLRGRVVDEGNKPIANAHVYIYTAVPQKGVSAVCPSCYRDCGKQTAVDANGKFRINGLDETLLFRALAVADGYEPAFSDYTDPLKQEVTFKLNPRAASDEERLVRGRVVDPKGKPVVGAQVNSQGVRTSRGIGYGNIPGVDALSITGSNGEFALRLADASQKLDVLVRARNFAPRVVRMLAPGKPATIIVNVGAAVAGRILHDGKPVAGAVVQFGQQSRASSDYLGEDEIGTGKDGRFLMTGLGPNEKYYVYPKMESLAPLAVTTTGAQVAGDASKIDIGTLQAARGRRIAGRVIALDGKVPPNTRVTLWRGGTVDARIAEVGANGTFAFDGVPHEAVSLGVRVRGFRPANMKLGAEDDITGIELAIGR